MSNITYWDIKKQYHCFDMVKIRLGDLDCFFLGAQNSVFWPTSKVNYDGNWSIGILQSALKLHHH
jgi:hypothetical protein